MRFVCEVCPDTEKLKKIFNYVGWLEHLVTKTHQAEVNRKLCPRKLWSDQPNTYVLKGILTGLPCSRLEFAQWLSSFGLLSEFFHDTVHKFCIFTLQKLGDSRNPKPKDVLGEKRFMGHDILVISISRFSPEEWNIVYDELCSESVEDLTTSGSSSFKKVAKTEKKSAKSKSKNKPGSSTSLYVTDNSSLRSDFPKNTVIYTNSNLNRSSNSREDKGAKDFDLSVKVRNVTSEGQIVSRKVNRQSIKKTTSNSDVSISPFCDKTNPQSNDVSLNSEEKPGKKKSRPSSSKRKKRHLIEPNHVVEIANNTRECASSNSLDETKHQLTSSDYLSSKLVVHKDLTAVSVKSEESTVSHVSREPESLSFRGGFTHSRMQQPRFLDISDSQLQVDFNSSSMNKEISVAVSSVAKTDDTTTQPCSSSKNNSQPSKQPQYQILPRNVSESAHLKNKPNEALHNRSSKQHNMPPVTERLRRKQEFVMSHVFVSQLPMFLNVNNLLVLPGTGRNPYNFNGNTPPFPYFFRLFQDFLNFNFKPNGHPTYKNFTKLPLRDQLEEFLLAQTLPHDEVRLRWQVMLDISYLLRQDYSNCELYAFGSIITGLGDISSDIDIYVDLLGETTCTLSVNPVKRLSSHEALDKAKRTITRNTCPHNRGRCFRNIVSVKSARVPIIKLTHVSTKISCDLSFENRLSVQNTKMMSFYLNYDRRVFPLMVLIRYWGKFHNITGSNHIKNYALTLLVLVFLTKKEIVPPIYFLQLLKAKERKPTVNSTNPDEIDGWDASFCDNIPTINTSFKSQPYEFDPDSFALTLMNLASEFFEMYANIDFSNVVVCTLLGDIMPKEPFLPGNEEKLPESLDRYKDWAVRQEMHRRLNINTCLCIQDPFMLSYNIGGVTPVGTLIRFQVASAKTAQILRKSGNLKSLFDALIRVPPHIGDKVFMKVYKTESKSDELRKEIKDAVGEQTKPQKRPQQQPHKSAFVTLPKHLSSLEKFLDEKHVKAAKKMPKWESYIQIPLDNQFESIFVEELHRCNMDFNKSVMRDKMCTLWHRFARDFLERIFVDGLKLTVVNRKDKASDVTSYNDQAMAMLSRKFEGRKRWQVKFPLDKGISTTKNSEEITHLRDTVTKLEDTPATVYYQFLRLNAGYPYWEKRSVKLLQNVIESMITGERVKIPETVAPEEFGEKKVKAAAEKDKKRSRYRKCLDPIHVEGRISDILVQELANEDKSFKSPFYLNILVKIDLSCIDERPYIVFLFEQDIESKHSCDVHVRALRCLSDLLTEAFPAFQIYHLSNWLKLTSWEIAQIDLQNEEDNLRKDDQPTRTNDIKDRKVEEDLLIPSSSSSSTCSSSPNLEDVVEDEDIVDAVPDSAEVDVVDDDDTGK